MKLDVQEEATTAGFQRLMLPFRTLYNSNPGTSAAPGNIILYHNQHMQTSGAKEKTIALAAYLFYRVVPQDSRLDSA
jgi:hypothetical protein